MFVLSSEIKNRSPAMGPVENYPLSNDKKISKILPLYDA